MPWRKATCVPSGAGGLPKVKPLLLTVRPALPAKLQEEPVGRYWYRPPPSCTRSNPASPIVAKLVSVTRSTKAVLSPPALSRAWKLIVCYPAPTVNAAVV